MQPSAVKAKRAEAELLPAYDGTHLLIAAGLVGLHAQTITEEE